MTKRAPTGDYDVGYARPPAHSQFPHQTRRPRAKRPREITTRQLWADFFAALDTKVTITRNGKKHRLPASQVIYEHLVAT